MEGACQYLLDRRIGQSHNQSEHGGKEEKVPARISTLIIQPIT
jgi:hypothetical protein